MAEQLNPPPVDEQREALLHAWLELRQRVTPTQFRTVAVGYERRVCARVWRNLRAICEHDSRKLATAESRAEAAKKARRYGQFEAWARDESNGPGMPDLDGYDPTRGNTLPLEEMAVSVPPDDPDYPWGKWIDPGVKELDRLIEETDLGEKLRAAGWFQQPAWMSDPHVVRAMQIIRRNVVTGDSLLHRTVADEVEE